MLHDTCLKTGEGLFVLVEILIEIAERDRLGTNDVLADAGQRQTAFGLGAGLFGLFNEFRVDECPFEAFALRVLFG